MTKPQNSALVLFAAVTLLMAVAIASCSGDDEEEQRERVLTLQTDQQVVVPTSKVRVMLGGTRRIQADSATVELVGELGGRDISQNFDVDLERDGEVGNLFVELGGNDVLWPRLEPSTEDRFRGRLEVSFRDVLGVAARGNTDDISWRFVENLAPVMSFESPGQVFANATIEVDGDGVLRPEEGQTVAVVENGSLRANKGHNIDLDGVRLPVDWTGSRVRGQLLLDPGVIGVHPGDLEATIRFENEFSDGTTVAGTSGTSTLDAVLDTTFIADLSPRAASRGAVVELSGRGFVPGDGQSGYGMLLRFEGTLTPADPGEPDRVFSGSTAPEQVPFDVVSDELLRQDVWYDVVDRQLQGLGAVPGVFDGVITPIVYDEYGDIEGVAWQGEFEVLPTRQMVYLKYLPSFSVALDRYGLANVEREVRRRILDVVNRDYEGINVEFVEEAPAGFAHYATIEMGGPDPTGGHAFGFDNTFNDQPKDTGNLHIDDYLGGINRETGEELNTPYGGVFVEEFANFSPTIHPEMSHGSDNFDQVFGPFMEELGGKEVRATEWPDGDRADDIEEAIRVFGNVVGNTVGHEMGHAMGLAHFEDDWDSPGERYHNHGGGGFIMDSGVERSFEQRAELDGQGPAVFNERNRAYLEAILPVP